MRVAAALAPVALLSCLLAVPFLALATEPFGGASVAATAAVPARALRAYQAVDGWCSGLRWQLVAAIGRVESGDGSSNGAHVDDATGDVSPWIFGPPLNGSNGTTRLPIGDWVGWFGLLGPWQQAVGPMQFLPATFTQWAVDGDGDGVADPHDIDDAAATTANYLCGGRSGALVDERAAVIRFNHDEAYATRVLRYAAELESAGDITLVCPVVGTTHYSDTFLAPRPGGRQHEGVDMFAAEGTPVVAPVSGDVDLGENQLGGLVLRLWGDDGNYYYGAHLSGFANATGHVEAGAIVGYVGHTGDAAATPPHLHFEIHPGRSRGDPPNPVDPTHAVAVACGT